MKGTIQQITHHSSVKRAALYVRVSTNEQNCDLQRIELLSFLDIKGWELFEIYEDKATGTNANRLFRSLKDLIITLQIFNELGIDFISHRDNLDLTSSTGRLMAHIIGAFAEFEAAIIKDRVIAGLNAAKANGKKLGRPKTRPSELIRALYRSGYSYSKIAELAKVSTQTAHAEIQEMLRLEKGISK